MFYQLATIHNETRFGYILYHLLITWLLADKLVQCLAVLATPELHLVWETNQVLPWFCLFHNTIIALLLICIKTLLLMSFLFRKNFSCSVMMIDRLLQIYVCHMFTRQTKEQPGDAGWDVYESSGSAQGCPLTLGGDS